MKTQTINAIAYSFDLLSFVFQKKEMRDKIKLIYLFGSAVRGELSDKSDIDLFFDCDKKDEQTVQRIAESGVVTFESSKDYEKWKLLHFTLPFSIQTGILDEWELKTSIASEGILLYSNKPITTSGERSVIFTIKHPKSKKKYVRLRRTLFGRDEEIYVGKGIVQSSNGKKLSSNVFIVPKTQQKNIMDILTNEQIEFSMTEAILF